MYKHIVIAVLLLFTLSSTAFAVDLPVPFRIDNSNRTLILPYPVQAGDRVDIDNQKSTTLGQGSIVLNGTQINNKTTARHVLSTTITSTQANKYPNQLVFTETVFTHWIDIYEIKVNGEVIFPMPDTEAPDNPTSVTATNITDKSLRLSWIAPTALDLQEIIIYRNGAEIARVPKGINYYDDTGLSPATEYVYKLVSLDQTGNESIGVITRASTFAPDTTPPGEITNIQTTVYNDRIRITWKNPVDTDYLEVRIYKNGVLVAVATTPATQFTDYDLDEHTTYTYLFRSVDTSGNYSPGVTVTETTKGKPPKVTGIRGVPGYAQADLNFNLSADREVTEYAIYQDGQKVKTVKAATANIQGLVNGTTYKFQVSAISKWGESELSDPVFLTPEEWLVGNIQNLRVIEKRTTKLKFAWNENPQAEKYLIQTKIKRKKTASAGVSEYAAAAPEETETYETAATEWEVNNLSPGDEVSITVSGFSAAHGSFGTSSLSVNVPLIDAPPENERPPNASDVVGGAFSLASNFWGYFLVGVAVLLTPVLFQTVRSALGKRRVDPVQSTKRTGRETNRQIRLDLRRK